MKTRKSHPLIFGTVILTVTGFLTRIIGFFYRIYLSRASSAKREWGFTS